MRSILSRALVTVTVVAISLLAGSVRAQDADERNPDISGSWHFRFDGDRGAMVLHFPATPEFGVFQVKGAGYTTLFPVQAFAVEEDSTQTLAFDSRGAIRGTIQLDDVTRTTAIGSLVVTRGTFDDLHDRLILRATITVGPGLPAKRVVLSGTRLNEPDATLTGRALDGRLVGRRVGSSAFDIQVFSGTASPEGSPPTPGEPYPFFILRSGGAVRIDGAETANVRIDGLMVSDRRGRLYGRVASAQFGGGVLRGQFVTNDVTTDGLTRFSATITFDGGRKLRISGVLTPFGG
jgi:hypothetical protein